jgi:hypothetical protein
MCIRNISQCIKVTALSRNIDPNLRYKNYASHKIYCISLQSPQGMQYISFPLYLLPQRGNSVRPRGSWGTPQAYNILCSRQCSLRKQFNIICLNYSRLRNWDLFNKNIPAIHHFPAHGKNYVNLINYIQL